MLAGSDVALAPVTTLWRLFQSSVAKNIQFHSHDFFPRIRKCPISDYFSVSTLSFSSF
jgi:hypothetical protein